MPVLYRLVEGRRERRANRKAKGDGAHVAHVALPAQQAEPQAEPEAEPEPSLA